LRELAAQAVATCKGVIFYFSSPIHPNGDLMKDAPDYRKLFLILPAMLVLALSFAVVVNTTAVHAQDAVSIGGGGGGGCGEERVVHDIAAETSDCFCTQNTPNCYGCTPF
jgi:hypothetical protein